MHHVMISIIIPIYNCEKFLNDCIDSVLNQTYKDFELILLDDGSNDRSLEICREYEVRDKRIRVFSHENVGVSMTRSRGVKHALGEKIVFIDSDDKINKDYLEVLLNEMISNNADVVCCNSTDTKSEKANIYIIENQIVTDKGVHIRAYFEKKRYAYCIWGKMFNTDTIRQVEFPDMKYSEDALIVQRIFNFVNKVSLINYYGYYYIDNPDGAMNKDNGYKQSFDMLTCTVAVSKLGINSEFITKRDISDVLVNETFGLLMNSSKIKLNHEQKILTSNLLTDALSFIPKSVFSVKGFILNMYRYMPETTQLFVKLICLLKRI